MRLPWPDAVAPFRVYLTPLGKESEVADAAESLYRELTAAGIDVFFDDRDARPGDKFADAELIGIPHRVVVSRKTLAANAFEYKHRTAADTAMLDRASLFTRLAG